MRNIYLVGFMGTGKTFVGRILAEKLKRPFVEMDAEIERLAGKPIGDIFREDGEDAFRAMETRLLEDLARQSGLVVSCGGGTVCNDYNLRVMKASGASFNLRSSPEKIYERTRNDTARPLLQVADPLAKIAELLAKREPYYTQAD